MALHHDVKAEAIADGHSSKKLGRFAVMQGVADGGAREAAIAGQFGTLQAVVNPGFGQFFLNCFD